MRLLELAVAASDDALTDLLALDGFYAWLLAADAQAQRAKFALLLAAAEKRPSPFNDATLSRLRDRLALGPFPPTNADDPTDPVRVATLPPQ